MIDAEWTTEDEIRYINNMGNYGLTAQIDVQRNRLRVMRLLRNYILAATNRFDWADMDKLRIVDAAHLRLSRLKQVA